MNEALPVGMAQCGRQTDGHAQEASLIDPMVALLDHLIQEFATRVLDDEYRSPLVTGQCQRLSSPCRIGRRQLS